MLKHTIFVIQQTYFSCFFVGICAPVLMLHTMLSQSMHVFACDQ